MTERATTNLFPCRGCGGSGRWTKRGAGPYGATADLGPCGFCAGSGRTATPPPAKQRSTFLGLPLRTDNRGRGVATDGVLRVSLSRTRLRGGPLTGELTVVESGRLRICRMVHPDLGVVERGLQQVVGHYERLPKHCPRCDGTRTVLAGGSVIDCDECYLASIGEWTGAPVCWGGERTNPCRRPAVAVSTALDYVDAYPPSLCRGHLADDLRANAKDLVEGGLFTGLGL